LKNFSYVPFISAKLSIVVKNTFTLTTFSIEEPAACRTAERFEMQSSVMAEIVEDSRVNISPVGVQGICPLQYMVEEVAIAWDWVMLKRVIGRERGGLRRVQRLLGVVSTCLRQAGDGLGLRKAASLVKTGLKSAIVFRFCKTAMEMWELNWRRIVRFRFPGQ
jgi:hypothetical protein